MNDPVINEVKIKPLSVNDAWQGRRYKTPEYKAYEKDLLLTLPPTLDIPDGDLFAIYEFGVSSKLSGWNDPIKPFQDVLQKKYGFDDRRIVIGAVRKVLVKKGDEYIRFNLSGEIV